MRLQILAIFVALGVLSPAVVGFAVIGRGISPVLWNSYRIRPLSFSNKKNDFKAGGGNEEDDENGGRDTGSNIEVNETRGANRFGWRNEKESSTELPANVDSDNDFSPSLSATIALILASLLLLNNPFSSNTDNFVYYSQATSMRISTDKDTGERLVDRKDEIKTNLKGVDQNFGNNRGAYGLDFFEW